MKFVAGEYVTVRVKILVVETPLITPNEFPVLSVPCAGAVTSSYLRLCGLALRTGSVSTSIPLCKTMLTEVSSGVFVVPNVAPVVLSAGASFNALTLTKNVRSTVAVLWGNDKVMATGPPLPLATGVTVAVQLVPEPPTTTFATGIKFVLLEDLPTLLHEILSSISAIVNEIGPVFESSEIAGGFEMAEIVGALLTTLIVTVLLVEQFCGVALSHTLYVNVVD